MRKLREYERVLVRCGADIPVRGREIEKFGVGRAPSPAKAKQSSAEIGSASFGKGMASAMPKQQPTSTAFSRWG
jgi:hypothetical protein